MAGISRVDFRQLKQFKKNIDKLDAAKVQKLASDIIKAQAAQFLRDVIQVTPTGTYEDGRVGGTLKRGWTSKSQREAEAGAVFGGRTEVTKYANSIKVQKLGNVYAIEIINPVEYASYVNNGHRTRNGGFVNGKFFLEIAESQLERKSANIIRKNVDAALRGAFNGN